MDVSSWSTEMKSMQPCDCMHSRSSGSRRAALSAPGDVTGAHCGSGGSCRARSEYSSFKYAMSRICVNYLEHDVYIWQLYGIVEHALFHTCGSRVEFELQIGGAGGDGHSSETNDSLNSYSL